MHQSLPFTGASDRRAHLRQLLALGVSAALRPGLAAAAPLRADPRPFSVEKLRRRAADLAGRPYQAPRESLPDALAELTEGAYREIRFRPPEAMWLGETPFTTQFFHPGFYYRFPVRIFEVRDTQAQEVLYTPALFDFGNNRLGSSALDNVSGFAGFRVHYALNDANYLDELVAFLGGTQFRALGRDMQYGLSARGLAIDTAGPAGEEFPSFTEFYLERPADANSLVIHALLNSPRCTGAYTFTVRPGDATATDVEMTLYLREQIDLVGIAPLTSMFLFDAHDRAGVDDYRPAVHDSDGLLIWNGAGEWLWRPVVNPARLRISFFVDRNPKGFGLMQRKRRYEDYLDPEARYERRPSAWVEPVGDWGEGAVMLLEIPTASAVNENIVAFWRPESPLAAGSEFHATYRLHWCVDAPPLAGRKLARVVDSRVGAGGQPERRHFVIEYGGDLPPAEAPLQASVFASRGQLHDVRVQFNASSGNWRASFELTPEGDEAIELRCVLLLDKKPVTETWMYQWTA